VVTDGEEDALSTHALETGSELDLRDGEGVTQVERTVHVSVREGTEPLGVLLLDLLHGDALGEEVGVRLDALGERSRVGLEDLVGGPLALGLVLKVNEVVTLVGLEMSVHDPPELNASRLEEHGRGPRVWHTCLESHVCSATSS